MSEESLTDEQIAWIEKLKKKLGIDDTLGSRLSENIAKRGRYVGIGAISDERGSEISEKTFNPIIIDIIKDLKSGAGEK